MPLRVRLRAWRETDLAPFRRMNADRAVMRFFPHPLSSEESDALARRIADGFKKNGFGLWVVEIPGLTEFAGFTGLSRPAFAPDWVEIAWRFDRAYWSKGYATEAAATALERGFAEFHLERIVAFTAEVNRPSVRLMERLGMRYTDAFAHPSLPAESPLSRHVLYEMDRSAWTDARSPFVDLFAPQI